MPEGMRWGQDIAALVARRLRARSTVVAGGLAVAALLSPGAPTSVSAAPRTVLAAIGQGSGLTLATSFAGTTLDAQVKAFGVGHFVQPPDTQLAAGPVYLVEAVNDTLAVFTRSGALHAPLTDLNAFFARLRPDALPAGFAISDPRVVYDRGSGRWFLSVTAFDSSLDSLTLLAVSSGPDPTVTAGAWSGYVVGPRTSAVLDDQPKLGVAEDKVVMAWDDYPACSVNHTCAITSTAEMWAVDKAGLVGGASAPAKSRSCDGPC